MLHGKKISLLLIAFIALSGLMAVFAFGTLQRLLIPVAQMITPNALFKLPAISEKKYIVLTIDDAPSDRTAEILDILDQHQVKATFFIHSDQINTKYRDQIMQRIAASGHDLGHHMPADISSKGMSPEVFRQAFMRIDQKNSSYGDAAKKYFRPPQGWYNPTMMDPVLQEFGYDTPLSAIGSKRRYILASFIPWDVTAIDHNSDEKIKIAERYTRQLGDNLSSGAIVIFHDSAAENNRVDGTVHALDIFLERAKSEYEILSLSQAIQLLAEQ